NHRREGRFEEADGGTLFLDEIGEIPLSIQVKLLRFLQQREFERVGGNRTISVDVRIIAATNRNLEEEVQAGRFREDLYYRLNVINIKMPALRARRSDIPLLVRHFAARYATENEKRITEISPGAMNALTQYDWPGNVRELENIIERAVVLVEGHKIEAHHLPSDFGHSAFSIDGQIQIPGSTLADIEKYTLLKTYEATGGNSAETARMLDISVRKVQYRIKEYQS
ncbi:MAG: sigma 54-interacting transcriptional regulator, partial [Bradymonadaceae bacterium]